MSTKLFVDKVITKARSHEKKGEIVQAKKLYQSVLTVFSNNKRAQQALAALDTHNKNNFIQNPPQEEVNQLVSLYNQGQISVVIQKAEVLVNKYPKTLIIWNILGVSLQAQGKLDQAITAYNKAISIKPYYIAYGNMGNALKAQGKLDKAITAYNSALSLKPDYPNAYYNIGNVLQEQGKLDQAITAYNKALSHKPDYTDAYINMGSALKKQGKLDEALKAFNKAISLKPDYAEIYNNIGLIFHNQGKFDQAIDAYKKAISLKPNYADTYSNMGNVFQAQGKIDQAITAYKNAISLNPQNAEAYNNMGVALKEQGKHDEAIEVFQKSISIKPNYADAYNNMGLTLQDKGKLEQAIEFYKRSISLQPDYAEAHQNLSLTLLNKGMFKEGLDEYEWRWKTNKGLSQQRQFIQPLWNGEKNLNDKNILLWSEQGLGDTINWSSRLSFITSQAKHCILECQEKLVPLFKRSFPNIEIKAENKNFDLERDDIDFHLPMGSIYKHFIEDIAKNTKVEAYLVPDPVRVQYWKNCLNSLGNGPFIGISWKSSNMSSNRLLNYAPISEWSPLLKVPNVTFINLQYKDFVDDLTKIQDELGVKVHNFDDLDHYNNLDDVAALCSALDMVVSTKITVTSISAGVGTSTKLVNWRQSTWNNIILNPVGPLVDIFERDTWEPWNKVFSSIAHDIFKLIDKRSGL